jgi:hypothetical protein
VNFGDVSGQVAIGKKIKQKQTIKKTITLSNEDQKNLIENFLQFQKEIAKMSLPTVEATNISSCVIWQ